MRQVINGKVYDTDTAKHIGSWWNGLGMSDSNNVRESLYQSKKGQFFLAGEGGANTCYAHSYGNTRSAGYGINLYTPKEALDWAERHLSTDEIEAHFTVEEG